MSQEVLFLEYPRCSTCKKAKAWLDGHDVAYTDRHIVEENPTAEELAAWHALSGLPVRRFFNTSGTRYRELGLKERLDAGMTDEECYELLGHRRHAGEAPPRRGGGLCARGVQGARVGGAPWVTPSRCRLPSSAQTGARTPTSRPASWWATRGSSACEVPGSRCWAWAVWAAPAPRPWPAPGLGRSCSSTTTWSPPPT